MQDARTALRDRCGGRAFRSETRGAALLGLVAVPGHVRLLLAAEVRRHALPGGHLACTVTQAAWVAADLPAAPPPAPRLSPANAAGLDRLRDFAVAGHHFYLETADLTRPFLSPAGLQGNLSVPVRCTK